jgi:hypothetical protein
VSRRRNRSRGWFSRRTLILLTGVVLAGAALSTNLSLAVPGSSSTVSRPPTTLPTGSSGPSLPTTAGTGPVPVYAYFYQWFNSSSWNRAKEDYPLAGRYSSDDAHVLRDQVQQAKGAGIDGFLTSWKSTDTLNRRLDLLIRIAKSENLDLGVVYQSLDFSRKPLPVATVEHDMVYLVERWGSSLKSSYYGRPVIIWTGTDLYTTEQVHAVRTALGDRAFLLAASHSVSGYERLAELVDGEAYYWSSADPTSPATTAKLVAMGQAVHAHNGLWIAPAASGYDGRTLGGTRVIGRDAGRTLVRSLDNAFTASPDGIAVISWNEWSENTYIEPGEKYGNRELVQLKAYLVSRGKAIPTDVTGADSRKGDSSSGWTGARAAVTLGLLTTAGVPILSLIRRLRSRRRRPTHRVTLRQGLNPDQPELHSDHAGTRAGR